MICWGQLTGTAKRKRCLYSAEWIKQLTGDVRDLLLVVDDKDKERECVQIVERHNSL